MLKNKLSKPKSSGAYMRVKIGYTINPMTCATTLADSNLVKLRTPLDFTVDHTLIFDEKSTTFLAKKQNLRLIFAKIVNIFAQIKKKL